ncbi:MAG: transposase [bacterium]|nr:transposase [Candidatus Microgenomates bacterium CPR3]MCQ3944740.1 transposase [bacterium]RIK51965.1 MAG: transposase [Candidatus Microgenomates bacterium]
MGNDYPVRRSIRLRGFDYSSNNLYFVTICTQGREPILSKVVGDRAFMSPYGRIVDTEWSKLMDRFTMIELDEYVIMPNHIHGIIGIRATVKVAPTLGQIIGAYKSMVVRTCLEMAKTNDKYMGKLWQRNYYEHIINPWRLSEGF